MSLNLSAPRFLTAAGHSFMKLLRPADRKIESWTSDPGPSLRSRRWSKRYGQGLPKLGFRSWLGTMPPASRHVPVPPKPSLSSNDSRNSTLSHPMSPPVAMESYHRPVTDVLLPGAGFRRGPTRTGEQPQAVPITRLPFSLCPRVDRPPAIQQPSRWLKYHVETEECPLRRMTTPSSI
jgi:hypothetical protein